MNGIVSLMQENAALKEQVQIAREGRDSAEARAKESVQAEMASLRAELARLKKRPEPTRDEVAAKTIAVIKRMTEMIESGNPIRMTQVTRHDTPDGPMHVRQHKIITQKWMIDDPVFWKRGTGRTTRMCDYAIEQAKKQDKLVMVYFNGKDRAQQFSSRIRDELDATESFYIRSICGLPNSFNWDRMIDEGYDPEKTIVLIDHWVIESDPIVMRKIAKATQFDLPGNYISANIQIDCESRDPS